MNREIKFRALDYKGNWQIGCYYFGVVYPDSFAAHYVNDTRIDENTLGQFTGLKDKNDQEIYEGDIVSVDPEIAEWLRNCPQTGYILFRNGTYYVGLEDNGITPVGYITDDKYVFRGAVLGNIFENPEMFKTETI